MVFYDSIWQYCPDTGRSTGLCFVFYQGGPIDHYIYIPGQVFQYSAYSECNLEFTSVNGSITFQGDK